MMVGLAQCDESARSNARLGVATLTGYVGYTHPQCISIDRSACGGSDA